MVPLVRDILVGPLPPPTFSSTAFFIVEESQTILVHSDLFPTSGGYPIPSVKMDHLLQFNREHPNVGEEVLNGLFEREPELWVSVFRHAVAGKTFTAGLVEVKAVAGDCDEGVYQFCVAASAVLQRLRGLRRLNREGREVVMEDWDSNDEDMPVVGWVVHGHFWYLHIAYRRKDGNIVSTLPVCLIRHVTE
jgi:hypothetical protein